MGQIAKQLAEMAEAQKKELAALETIAAKPATSTFAGAVDESARVSGGESAAKDKKGLGFARAVRCLALSKIEGKSPYEIAERLEKGGSLGVNRVQATIKALGESTAGAGGVLAPDEFSSEFIEILRPELALAKAGIRVIPMSGQSLSRGRESAASTATWMGENQTITYTQPSFDSPQLNLKKLGAIVAVSNDLLRDQAVSADVIVRDDLVKVSLLAVDLAMIRGLGSAFQPKGIRYWVPSANLNSSSAGAATPTLQNAGYDFEVLGSGILNQGNIPVEKRATLLHPRTVSGLRQLKDGIGRFPIAEEMDSKGTIFGLKYFPTTQIPINLSGGGSGTTKESEIYVLEATQCEAGMGIQPTVEVSRDAAYTDANSTMQSSFANDQTVIRCITRCDFIMRHNPGADVIQGCTYGA